MTKEETTLLFFRMMMRNIKVSWMILLLLPCRQAELVEEVRSRRQEMGEIKKAVH
jgi:hypothetical protein